MAAPRKDQVRNRQRLVAAARQAFVELGPEVSLETVARRAGVGTTTLYRHFPSKEEMVEAVLDELIQPVQENAERAEQVADPHEAFRFVFAQGCTMPEEDVLAFARLAAASARAERYANALVVRVVRGVTERLREAGGLRPDLTAEDIAMFVRMADAADSREHRIKATEILLAGITRVAPHEAREAP